MMSLTLPTKKTLTFDPKKFLATIGHGTRIVAFSPNEAIFTQGDTSDAVFYIQEGKVRLTVVSKTGKGATLSILNDGVFFRRSYPSRTVATHEFCNRNDGLRNFAH